MAEVEIHENDLIDGYSAAEIFHSTEGLVTSLLILSSLDAGNHL
jgi:hypothetical protein